MGYKGNRRILIIKPLYPLFSLFPYFSIYQNLIRVHLKLPLAGKSTFQKFKYKCRNFCEMRMGGFTPH